MSEVPWTSVRTSIGARSATMVEAATVAQRPAQAEQEQPGEDLPRVPSGDDAHSTSDDQQHRSRRRPGRPRGRTGRRACRPAARRRTSRARGRDHEPDDLEVRAAVLHVERRHDHHRDHRRVGAAPWPPIAAADQPAARADRDDARPTSAEPRDVRPTVTVPRGSRATSSGSGRSSTEPDRRASDHAERHRCANGPVSSGMPSASANAPAGPAGWARARRRSSSPTRPIDSARRAVLVGREVGGGVARPRCWPPSSRRAAAAPSEQQQHRADDAGDHGERPPPAAPEEVAGDQPDPAPAARHHAARRTEPTAAGRAPARSARGRPAPREPEMSLASSEAVAMPMVIPSAPTAWADDERSGRCGAGRLATVEAGRRWRRSPLAVRQLERRHTAAHTCFGRHAGVERLLRSVRPPRSRDHVLLGPGAGVGRARGRASSRAQNSVCLMATPHHATADSSSQVSPRGRRRCPSGRRRPPSPRRGRRPRERAPRASR